MRHLLIFPLLFIFVSSLNGETVTKYRGQFIRTAYGEFLCGTYPNRMQDELFSHQIRFAESTRQQSRPSPGAKTYRSADVVIIEDDGRLVKEPGSNAFDLDGKQLFFTPNVSGSYDVDFVPMRFDTLPGIDVNAGDDTNHLVDFTSGFTFSYFDTEWDHIWIRSNGNVTFGDIGNPAAYDPRDFIAALPMIAAFFADLDPGLRGRIHYRQEHDRFIVTWDGVTEFAHFNRNSIQLTLFPDGSFSIAYNGIGTDIPQNGLPLIVGFNSGKPSAEFESVDFSALPLRDASAQALFEAFDRVFYREIDLAMTARRFYAGQPDSFDQLVMLTNFDLLNPPFSAFHTEVRNDTYGIGRDIADHSALFGSAGRLQSFIHMNEVQFWPDLPDDFFLIVLAHETAHRWASYVRFNDNGRDNDFLLGSGLVHWSFLHDTDGSVLFGNNWRDNGDGTFTSLSALNNYSFLDHYLMGLRNPEEVPDFFFIDFPGVSVDDRARFPEFGLVAAGSKRQVSIDDIVAAEGPRLPDKEEAQKVFRQAFILLTREGQPVSQQEIDKVQRFKGIFSDRFSNLTDGRAVMQTQLGAELPVAAVVGNVTDAQDGSIIQDLEVTLVEDQFSQPVPNGGAYDFRIQADSSEPPQRAATIVIRAFPFVSDTSQILLTFGASTRHDRALIPLPRGALTGNLKNQGGKGVKAKLTLYLSSDLAGDFTIVDSSDAQGNYTFDNLLISFPAVVRYEQLVIEPEAPYLTRRHHNIAILEGAPTVLDFRLEPADVLVVNDDPNGEFAGFYLSALDSLELDSYVWAQREQGVAPVGATAGFNTDIMIWYTGNAVGDNILTASERDTIAMHLAVGGRLFLTGQNIAESLEGSDFLRDTLHATYLGNINDKLLHGVQSDPVGSGLFNIDIGSSPGANNQNSSDAIRADSLARVVILYDTTFANFAAGLRYEDPSNGSRLVFFGFGFEAIDAGAFPRPHLATREKVMNNILNWLSDGTTSVSEPGLEAKIEEFALLPNFPNPFNGETFFSFRVPSGVRTAHIELEIFNLLGRKVNSLLAADFGPGEYRVRWDGRDHAGLPLASGVYVYRLTANNFQKVRKLIFMK